MKISNDKFIIELSIIFPFSTFWAFVKNLLPSGIVTAYFVRKYPTNRPMNKVPVIPKLNFLNFISPNRFPKVIVKNNKTNELKIKPTKK